MKTKDEVFIERREGQGDYALRRPNSRRASAMTPTQKEAIARGYELAETVLVERVRDTETGGRDKWRKPLSFIPICEWAARSLVRLTL